MIIRVLKLGGVFAVVVCGIASLFALECLPGSSPHNRQKLFLARFWNRLLARILGIHISIRDQDPADLTPIPGIKGRLLAANHLSYLDAIALGAILPVRFVAKLEVRSWPLLGRLVSLAGTIFVDRDSPRQAVRSAHEIAASLKAGASVLFFPEGTSSNGERVLEFKPLLFTGALRAEAPVQPVSIRYTGIDGHEFCQRNRDLCCWYGSMEFAGHFWSVLGLKTIDVSIEVHDMIDSTTGTTIHELAAATHKAIADSYLPPALPSEEESEAPNEFILGALVLALANSDGVMMNEE